MYEAGKTGKVEEEVDLPTFSAAHPLGNRASQRRVLVTQLNDCDPPSATPTFGPDSQVTGVVDHGGCPVAAADVMLGLGALTPWFHCAPWPPVLQLDAGGDGTTRRFWQYVSDSSEVVNTTAPDDAIGTGWFIAAGEILTSASEPRRRVRPDNEHLSTALDRSRPGARMHVNLRVW